MHSFIVPSLIAGGTMICCLNIPFKNWGLNSPVALSVSCWWITAQDFFRTCSGWRELPYLKLLPTCSLGTACLQWLVFVELQGWSLLCLHWEHLWRGCSISAASGQLCSFYPITCVFPKTTLCKRSKHKSLSQVCFPGTVTEEIHQVILSTYHVLSMVLDIQNTGE